MVDLDNARLAEQKQVMKRIVTNQDCPFCEENLRKYHHQPILRQTKYWLLTPNQWPYQHTKIHLLAIYRHHAEKLADLAPEAGAELIELAQWAEKHYHIPGGALCLRFGNTDYSAGSVVHLHAQLIVPDVEATDYLTKPVRFKIGKTNH